MTCIKQTKHTISKFKKNLHQIIIFCLYVKKAELFLCPAVTVLNISYCIMCY